MDKQLYLKTLLYFCLLVALIIIYIKYRLAKYDPLSKPKGLVLLVIMSFVGIDEFFSKKLNENVSKYITPCIVLLVLYFGTAIVLHVCINYLQFMHYVGLILCLTILEIVSSFKQRKKGE